MTTDTDVEFPLEGLDRQALRTDFVRQGAFLALDDLLPADVTARLAHSAHALLGEVNRNYLPGHKKGGSVSRHTIDKLEQRLLRWMPQTQG